MLDREDTPWSLNSIHDAWWQSKTECRRKETMAGTVLRGTVRFNASCEVVNEHNDYRFPTNDTGKGFTRSMQPHSNGAPDGTVVGEVLLLVKTDSS